MASRPKPWMFAIVVGFAVLAGVAAFLIVTHTTDSAEPEAGRAIDEIDALVEELRQHPDVKEVRYTPAGEVFGIVPDAPTLQIEDPKIAIVLRAASGAAARADIDAQFSDRGVPFTFEDS